MLHLSANSFLYFSKTQYVDEAAREYQFKPNEHVSYQLLRKFLGECCGNESQKGFVFTLNQDLFFERKLLSGLSLEIPGARRHYRMFKGSDIDRVLPIIKENEVYFGGDDDLAESVLRDIDRGVYFYIKLHGSFAWSQKVEGQAKDVMVIGIEKEGIIEKYPILKIYRDIFRRALYQPGRKLMVIGYGFRDDHINKIISEAIEKHGMGLFIITTEELTEILMRGPVAIPNGLRGYYRARLEKVLPAGKDQSKDMRRIYREYFRKDLV